jgi:hypothetical protein
MSDKDIVILDGEGAGGGADIGAGAGAGGAGVGGAGNAFAVMAQGAAAVAAVGAKRKVQSSEQALAERRWADWVVAKPYLKADAVAKRRYVDECVASSGARGVITCTWCDGKGHDIAVGSSTGNLTKHEGTAPHLAEAKKHLATTQMSMLHSLVDHKRAMLSEEEKIALAKLLRSYRALTHAATVSYGVAPANLENVIAPSSAVFIAAQLLAQHHVDGIGSRSTVGTDLPDAYLYLLEELRNNVKGTQGTLLADGGTLRQSSKGVIIMYMSRQLSEDAPILLDVCMPSGVDEQGNVVVYDYEKCAVDIRKACTLMDIDLPSQVRDTTWSGDRYVHVTAPHLCPHVTSEPTCR